MAKLLINGFLSNLWGRSRFDKFYKETVKRPKAPDLIYPFIDEGDVEFSITPYFLRTCVQVENDIPLADEVDARKVTVFLNCLANDSRYSDIRRFSDLKDAFLACMQQSLSDLKDKEHHRRLQELNQKVRNLLEQADEADSKEFILPTCERIFYACIGKDGISEDELAGILNDTMSTYYIANIDEKEIEELERIIRYNGLFTVTGLGRLELAARKGNDLAAISLGNYFLYNHHYQQAYDLFSYRSKPEEQVNATLDTSVSDFLLNYKRYKENYGEQGVVEQLEELSDEERWQQIASNIEYGLSKGSPIAKNMLYNNRSRFSRESLENYLPGKFGDDRTKDAIAMLEEVEQAEYPYIYNNLFLYYRDKNPNPNLALKYIRMSADLGNYYGQIKAAEWLMEAEEGTRNAFAALEYLCDAVYCSHISKEYSAWISLHRYFYRKPEETDVNARRRYDDAQNALRKLRHETKFRYCIYGEHARRRFSYLNLDTASGEDILFVREAIAYMKEGSEAWKEAVAYLQSLLGIEGCVESIEVQDGYSLNGKQYGSYFVRLFEPYEGFRGITLTQEILAGLQVGDRVRLSIPCGLQEQHLVDYCGNHIYPC